jgi:hypothetical protein
MLEDAEAVAKKCCPSGFVHFEWRKVEGGVPFFVAPAAVSLVVAAAAAAAAGTAALGLSPAAAAALQICARMQM